MTIRGRSADRQTDWPLLLSAQVEVVPRGGQLAACTRFGISLGERRRMENAHTTCSATLGTWKPPCNIGQACTDLLERTIPLSHPWMTESYGMQVPSDLIANRMTKNTLFFFSPQLSFLEPAGNTGTTLLFCITNANIMMQINI